MRPLLVLALLVPSGIAAQAPPPVANSPLQWEVREGKHPRMGPIVVAVPRASVVTPAGKERIASLVFFSCERSKGRIAIELANAPESDAKSGLFPRKMPRLFCNPRSTAPRAELKTTWFVSELGDALARDIAPAELRRCASIDVEQDVALPRGWGGEAQRIDIELIPYKKELDSVLTACNETPAVAAAPSSPPPAKPQIPGVAEIAWRPARVIASGRTNVRAGPDLAAAVVVQLDPGALVLVQKTTTAWWKARPRTGSAFGGYIREDRLVFTP